MPQISLRKRWSEAHPHLSLSAGIVRGGLAGHYVLAPEFPAVDTFPHRSLRGLLSACRWPDGNTLVRVNENPKAVQSRWTRELNALQLDGEYWYAVTAAGAMYRIPRSTPLQDATGAKVEVPAVQPGWPHGGGASLFKGYLYVAVHGEDGGDPTHGQVWAIRVPDMVVVERIDLPEPGIPLSSPRLDTIPFVAIHPRKPLLYTMPFDGPTIRVYRIFPLPGAPGPDGKRLQFLAAFTPTDEAGDFVTLKGVQNAVITPNEHLLVLCDVEEKPRGLHLFDLLSGRRRWHRDIGTYTTEHEISIPFKTFKWKGWEAEVLFVKDMGVDGLIHVGNLDKGRKHDDLTIANIDFVNDLDRELL